MIRYSIFLVFVILLVSCKSDSKESDAKKDIEVYDLVLENGNVIDLETSKISVSSIFINNGKIVKIRPSIENLEFTGKQVYDISGKFVLPGFWDNHVHFRGGDSLIEENKSFLKLFIKNGITTVRDAGGDLTTSVMQWKEDIATGKLLGPTIYTSGPKIDGPNARWAGSLEVANKDDIKNALDSLQSLNVDFVKIYDSTISGKDYLETIKEASKRGMITSGHMPFTVELNETVDAGIGAIEHLYYVLKGSSKEETAITKSIQNKEYGFWESMAKLVKSYDDSTAANSFQHLKENDVYVVPTLHIGDVLSYLDEVDHTQDKYLKFMGKGIIATYEGRIKSAMNASEQARKERKELNLFFKNLVNNLNKNGVKLLAGSDSGAYNSYTYPGFSLHEELKAMVKAGLSPVDALKTSAYNGSRFLKKDHVVGDIREGLVADLVILNGNPLEDIGYTSNIDIVILRGLLISNDSLR